AGARGRPRLVMLGHVAEQGHGLAAIVGAVDLPPAGARALRPPRRLPAGGGPDRLLRPAAGGLPRLLRGRPGAGSPGARSPAGGPLGGGPLRGSLGPASLRGSRRPALALGHDPPPRKTMRPWIGVVRIGRMVSRIGLVAVADRRPRPGRRAPGACGRAGAGARSGRRPGGADPL